VGNIDTRTTVFIVVAQSLNTLVWTGSKTIG